MTGLPLGWMDGSLGYALAWWAVLAGVGTLTWAACRPRGWQDGGYAVARQTGVLAAATGLWVLAHATPLFTRSGVIAATLAMLLGAWLLGRGSAGPPVGLRVLLAAEARFALPYAGFLLMRGFNGDVVGLEKFMDFAFLNAAFHAPVMPPPDPWFSGYSINYYYFGHFFAAFLCHLTGTPPPLGYNLMLATLFAGVFQLAWALVVELTAGAAPRVRGLAGAVAACWITLGGNLHGFLYGLTRPALVWLGLLEPPAQAFLASDPTRFVGYNPPTADKLITEFPAYAFYVGDLHAHLLNLPNVLLFLCLVLTWLRAREAGRPARAALAGAAGLLGLFVATNSWDAPMYGLLLGGLLLRGMVRSRPCGWRMLLEPAISALAAGSVALVFLVGFRPPGEGVGLVHSNTPVWQWLVLYGLQAGLAGLAAAWAWRRRSEATATMILALAGCGLVFALVPEVIFVRDIYGAEFYRGNTAFKFGFQAFLLFTLGASVALAGLVEHGMRRQWRPVLVILALEGVLVPPLAYSWFVVGGALEGARHRPWSLNGARHLARRPGDAPMVEWLSARRQSDDVLIEAVGDSYSYAARISTHTAIPAVLGWPVHELLWRRRDPEVEARRGAVATLYEARDGRTVREVAARFGARWIVVGETERALHPALDEAALRASGPAVFEAGRAFIVDLRPAPP